MRSCRFYGSVSGVSRHFSAALADTLLRIAEEEAYRPHWLADVLAAAVAGGCEVLVTFNLEAFPEEYRCEPSRLGCLSPRHCGAELRKHPDSEVDCWLRNAWLPDVRGMRSSWTTVPRTPGISGLLLPVEVVAGRVVSDRGGSTA